jgi:hypothetical protein
MSLSNKTQTRQKSETHTTQYPFFSIVMHTHMLNLSNNALPSSTIFCPEKRKVV